MALATLAPGARVLVLDDDEYDAEAAVCALEDAEFDATALSRNERGVGVDEFLATECAEFDALVCDHVLNSSAWFGFAGAELVSRANSRPGRPLPAVLVTSHRNTDETGAISRWRAGIPVVVDKPDLTEEIVPALEYTVRELRGEFREERRRFTTPIEVLDVFDGPGPRQARVVVVGWHLTKSVYMPLDPVLEATGLRPHELRGRWLEAKVNCYATRADDLYYTDIVVAPDMPAEFQL
ncbi:hypothetical protein GCM10023205_01520 [Yinghuangia aomiensis]|uniref:Response regulatory domain-containing protein n=1 Tax=Yinghuangia aomiensis TaxID=676205 RepID=A0ABP9GKJ6_9ACTN